MSFLSASGRPSRLPGMREHHAVGALAKAGMRDRGVLGSGSPGRGAPAGAAPQVSGLSGGGRDAPPPALRRSGPGAHTPDLLPAPEVSIRPWFLLAGALSRRSGLPACQPLGPRLWGGANAGLDRSARTATRFRRRWAPPGGLVLVDDVVTTGLTLGTAAQALGCSLVLGGGHRNRLPLPRSGGLVFRRIRERGP